MPIGPSRFPPASVLAVNGGSSTIKFAVYPAGRAVALFCYSAKKWVGALAAALGGLETLVFTGGIGEHSAVVRARICDGLGFLGVELDDAHNAAHAALVSTDASRVSVRVIPTDEERMIARAVRRVLGWAENISEDA